ncbi:MAG TPA: flagellar biosynthetic protein FliR [Acidiferrobacterales bacterium]|nr:flagellar biosynthetic protein FliR [Acidiferrobacterales bacterium]
MHFTSAEITAWIGAFLWPFFRIAAMFTSAAVFGMRALPMRLRLMLALAVALVLAPLAGPMPAVELMSAEGFIITGQQIVIGIVMGFMLRMVFAALELAGEMIGSLMGLGFASLIDPQNGVQVPVVSQFYVLLATLMFLALNGHLLWIEAVAESFRLLPVGLTGIAPEGAWALVGFASQVFGWAVRMALPVVAALLVVNLAFGVLARTSPQLNVFSVGFPAALLIGLALVLMTLPSVLHKVGPLTAEGLEQVGRALAAGH